jgi:DNA-binding PadR family transcriptional regulator
MAQRRKVGNLLALAVLSALMHRPMHPYEVASSLRNWGKESSMKIKWGSLYTVIQNLEKHGLIEATATTREGRRPERTVYGITADGKTELMDWLRDLLANPEREYPRFQAALATLAVLPVDEVTELLERRVRALDAEMAAQRAALKEAGQVVPRLFLIEDEYHLAMRQAEADWVRSLLVELADGTLVDLAAWREYSETGQAPPEWAELAERSMEQ